ncbi:N-arachidonyl glycine receptor-like [Protopterus annectens]|uniref:N-arachidonyl glycine receptor-like n=1 Tax=Protopterus annectens TaxID=7888 RepID=UPI001CFC3441|nr:N-arachidonyl glycine receptor-like [Protopterus annectens]
MTIQLAMPLNTADGLAIFITYILLATAIVFVSGSVVLAILTTKSLRKENRFIYMLNTSISDLFTGLGMYYNGLFDVRESYPLKNSTYFILPTLLGINFQTIFVAQLDRYVAICHPYFYCRQITESRTITVCVFIWVYAYSLTLTYNLVTQEVAARINAVTILGATIGTFFTMIGLNLKLYLIATHQLSREPERRDRDSKKASLRLIILVTLTFLTLWSPAFINACLTNMSPFGIRFYNGATDPFSFLLRLNPLTTPVLYISGSRALKAAVFTKVWKPCCKTR